MNFFYKGGFGDEDQRVEEVARMLAGAEITDLTIKHAQELITTLGQLRK